MARIKFNKKRFLIDKLNRSPYFRVLEEEDREDLLRHSDINL